MLTHEQAKKFYDSFGRKQDKQFYEEKAITTLIEQGHFDNAEHVVEFGCGTGKLAARLLNEVLPRQCHYTGIDISETMVALCQQNTAPYAPRAKCYQGNGKPVLDISMQSADHFISAYVLDLLDEKDVHTLLEEAHRILKPGGFLCLASLGHGKGILSRTVETIWNLLFRVSPAIVGGCRPVSLHNFINPQQWQLSFNQTIVSYGIPSEVLIATRC